MATEDMILHEPMLGKERRFDCKETFGGTSGRKKDKA
jgi:hypothetical protein